MNREVLSVLEVLPVDLLALHGVATVHMAAFPDSALSALGAEAIRRYYEWQLDPSHQAVALCALHERKIVGFCFGGLFVGSLRGFLKKNRKFLLWRILSRPWLLAVGSVRAQLKHALRTLWRQRRRRANQARLTNAPLSSLASFGVLALAVHPDCGRMGIGALLMAHMEDRARALGFAAMDLSVHRSNRIAIQFYSKLNWTRDPDNDAWCGVMRKTLAP